MNWLYLFAAALLEIVWASGLKYTAGFTRPVPSLIVGLAMAGSMGLLALAVRSLPIGTAYAVWTGLGAVGTAAFGMIVLHESAAPARLLCLGLIVAGVVGLKWLGK